MIKQMQGLQLCELFFWEKGLPALEKTFENKLDRMAFGLVGEGSDCYGFDDDISQDHDWGPGFCIWLNQHDYKTFGSEVQDVYDCLPSAYKTYGPRVTTQWGKKRVGVLEIQEFYSRFVGKYQPPSNNYEWLAIPENYLATATNGKVFQDNLGVFAGIRKVLLDYYPEDVRLKKIAARCMSIGQAGQYNFPRSIKRGEFYVAQHAQVKFSEDIMYIVFLLNRRYAPFYKWIHRAIKELPVLGSYIYKSILNLVQEYDNKTKVDLIEEISQVIIKELKNQELSNHQSDYLPDHGPLVQHLIQDKKLRETNILVG